MASHVIDITHTTHPPAISPLPPHSHTHTSTFRKIEKRERRERGGEKEEEGEGKEGTRKATSPWLEDVAGTMLHLIHDVKFAEVGGEGHPEHLLQP